jgi:HTH-type transcriptional regulator / antitoxin HigA
MESTLERAAKTWDMLAPVIDTPKDDHDYDKLLSDIEIAIDLNRDRNSKELLQLINSMSTAALNYQAGNSPKIESTGLDALRYLVKLHRVRQNDLPEIGSQGVVSEVLSGKRALTLRHVKGLSKRFKVSPNTFIDL